MAKITRRRSAYKKARKKKTTQSKGRRRLMKLLRAALIVVSVLLLVLPVLLLAHPISYIPLIMVVSMVVLSWLYLQVVDRSVSATINSQEYNCGRGESAGLEVSITNSCPLPVPRVELDFIISNLFDEADDARSLMCSLAPFETLNVAFDAQFPHLGKYEAGIRSVAVYDLLGLFSRRHKDGTMNSVIVSPAKVVLGGMGETQAAEDESNNAMKPITSDNEDYASVREYQLGDPLKTIHWNLSSRNPDGTLYTRLFEEYVNPTMCIVVDHVSPDLDGETLMSLFDGIVEVSAALSHQAKFSGIDAEVRYFDQNGEEAALRLGNEDDINEFIDTLHRIVRENQVTEPFDVEGMLRKVGLQSRGFGNVMLVTSRTDSGCFAALRDIAARRKSVTAFVAVPRDLVGREREKFWAPVAALGASGISHYAVESTPLETEVIGL